MPRTPEVETFLESIAPYSNEGVPEDTGDTPPQGVGGGDPPSGGVDSPAQKGEEEGGGAGDGEEQEDGDKDDSGDDEIERDHPPSQKSTSSTERNPSKHLAMLHVGRAMIVYIQYSANKVPWHFK